MNENEISRIAAAINCLRPDWPAASIATLIQTQLANRTRRDVAVALAWVACESATGTPARVLAAGPWWQAATVEEPKTSGRQPPKRGEECELHPGEWRGNCRCCAADAKAARSAAEEAQAVRTATTREQALASARAAVKAARAATTTRVPEEDA